MIFQLIKGEAIKEKKFHIFGALTGNQFDKITFTSNEIKKLSDLEPEKLFEYISHLTTRIRIKND